MVELSVDVGVACVRRRQKEREPAAAVMISFGRQISHEKTIMSGKCAQLDCDPHACGSDLGALMHTCTLDFESIQQVWLLVVRRVGVAADASSIFTMPCDMGCPHAFFWTARRHTSMRCGGGTRVRGSLDVVFVRSAFVVFVSLVVSLP